MGKDHLRIVGKQGENGGEEKWDWWSLFGTAALSLVIEGTLAWVMYNLAVSPLFALPPASYTQVIGLLIFWRAIK